MAAFSRQVPEENPRMDNFEIISQIGVGNFSVIHKVKDKTTGEISALKIFEKAKVARIRKTKDVIMERYVLEKLEDSPYVANIYEKWKDDLHCCIRLEYLEGGELWDICKVFG